MRYALEKIWKTTASLLQLRLQWEKFENFKWQHPVFYIGMWSPLWKPLNSVWTATVRRKSPELDKEKVKRTLPSTRALMVCCTAKSFLLFPCLAPVIFVLQLPFQRYLCFFTMEITFQCKKLGVAIWNFQKFLSVTVTVWVILLFSHIILEHISHNSFC